MKSFTSGKDAKPIVGAIRWDAWHGDRGAPGRAVQKTLSPRQWHYRLPFFAEVAGADLVRIDGATPAVMDREIEYASGAGLTYWAFVTYAPDNPMSLALDLYLASRLNSRINFCLIVEAPLWAAWEKAGTPEWRRRFAQYFRLPNYQTVQGGRPLLFLLQDPGRKDAFGSRPAARQFIAEFRRALRQEGLQDPYIAMMRKLPAKAWENAREIGVDAISEYAFSIGTRNGMPYVEATAGVRASWNEAAAAGARLIPTVSAGWDPRPRLANPVPWIPNPETLDWMMRYHATPRPPELAAHLQEALDFVQQHPAECESGAVLIYAWNENDEGGWLVPTIGEGPARLDVIRSVLHPAGAPPAPRP